ncbi:glycosyl transferase family protein [Beggiatoa leptomitoformis]|uniref:Glycosyl transferase family protein n=1 Tax=Beggiatoa leptomitoformis TaxID=288004 RepID=A0A2N9YAF8_9GAMM|nr:glycosyl transferase family protein [Beggiatoa leptomitoformis]ALG67154.1 glycosyl transferase family protein [Beggiatoa leptomitoformis]AUI67445.1 glycosyl transferase family protein [Beggiatoa leptomitoformis]
MRAEHDDLFNHYTEHPFAQYIRALGKGKNGARPLTREESYHAMQMIVSDAIEPVQLGAFMMLMRVKEETREELAGFVQAVRDSFPSPTKTTTVDLDWSSYAGKRRHLPWFLLATLLLANNGVKVFMHGAGGHTNGRIYTKDVLQFLGLPYATTFAEAETQLQQYNFSYFPLEYLCPTLQKIMDLRPLMGLRSPIHTIVRMINPFNAPYMMQGIFHPSFRDVHQEAGQLLNQPHLAVIKGEGGEIERNPDIECLVKSLHNGELSEELWQPLFKQRHVKEAEMNPERLVALWRGDIEDEFAVASITGTVAISLKLMGKASTQTDAQALAEEYWATRQKQQYNLKLNG